MPSPWYPGAVENVGVNAGYRSGHSNMRAVICHYTVGRDSTGIGKRGYFNWLISRSGEIQAFAEADAITWHAGEANDVGPGIEIEYLPGVDDTVFTDEQRSACAGLIAWLHNEWGIPDEYYDSTRIAPSRMRGFVSHRSVLQSDPHSDWWPQEDWDLMTAGPPPGPVPLDPSKEFDVFLMRGPTSAAIVTADEVYIVQPADFTVPHVAVDQAQWDYIINDVRAKFTQKYA